MTLPSGPPFLGRRCRSHPTGRKNRPAANASGCRDSRTASHRAIHTVTDIRAAGAARRSEAPAARKPGHDALFSPFAGRYSDPESDAQESAEKIFRRSSLRITLSKRPSFRTGRQKRQAMFHRQARSSGIRHAALLGHSLTGHFGERKLLSGDSFTGPCYRKSEQTVFSRSAGGDDERRSADKPGPPESGMRHF